MQALIASIYQKLVNHPEDIRIEISSQAESPLYLVHTHKDDVGQAVGKHGRIANAVRVIIKCAARNENGGTCFLEIVDGNQPAEPEEDADLKPSAKFRTKR